MANLEKFNFSKLIYQYSQALLDFIYPPVSCIVCNSLLKGEEEYGMCHNCLKDIPFIHTQRDKDSFLKGEEVFFNKLVAAVEYKGIIKKLIFRFKYHDATYLARNFALLMISSIIKEELEKDIIISVPLHPEKEKQRGYNQSHLLAKYISKSLGIEYQKDNLIRCKNTKVMHNLSKKQRKENLKDAFKIKDNTTIRGKNIMLIDDIFTTGATVNACSKVLIEGGGKSVTVVTLARSG